MSKENKTMKLFKLLLVIIFSLSLSLAWAGVNLKNGNFYVAYTDIVVPGGGKKLEIVRTYNSRVAYNGWFGVGWGSDYETFLRVSADGSVTVHENGGGARTRFIPKAAIDPMKAAKKVADAMMKKTTYSSQEVKKLIHRLAKNAEVRHAYAKKYGVAATLASGTKLYSNSRGLQELHVTRDGFKRIYSDGRYELFGKQGKLTKIKNPKNKHSIDLKYKKGGELISIKDSAAKQMFFEWYSNGKVKHIWSGNGDKKTHYIYKGNDLVKSTDIGKHIYEYKYDRNHCMTTILYSDKSKMKLSYDKRTQFITKIEDRNRDVIKYKYEYNPRNPDGHYWTSVTKKGYNGKPVVNRYEYEIRRRPDGSQYTHRILTKINNVKTETIYSECCSLPVKISRGKHVTNFEYDRDGLLTKKTSTKGDFTQIEYNKVLKKISKVVNRKGWTKFTYDKKANLVKAVNNKGKSVLLIYNSRGQITKMVDKSKKRTRTLSFKYNAIGKPEEIVMEKAGKIKVLYDNYGEIKKVESKAGYKMAMQVTKAFQNLLAIVKPAGVNLSM